MTTAVPKYMVCNKMIFQDDGNYRCILPLSHYPNTPCVGPRPNYNIHIEAAQYRSEVWVEDPNFKRVSRGYGIQVTVPNWIAEALELLATIQQEQQ